jgi:capsid protein
LVTLGNVLDKFIGVFSPASEFKRMTAREAIRASSSYAAAQTTVSTGGWTPADPKINTLLQNSLGPLRSRARQLVRDMPAMATAVDRLVDFQVGTGLTLQAKVKGSDGKLNTKLNNQIEDAWKYWCNDADESGRLHFNEIQQLCCREEVEVGEYVVIKKMTKERGRYLPFTLQLVESDSLSSYGPKPIMANEIMQGVE